MSLLENQVELIQRLYQVNQNEASVFSSLDLWVEIFAEKRLCAYDPRTNEVRLIRKEQKKFDEEIKKILRSLAIQEEDETLPFNPMLLLAQTTDQLGHFLKETYPENHAIEFGNFGFEGAIQVMEVNSVQQKHGEVIIKSVIDKVIADYEDELEEQVFDWRE